MKEPVSRPPCKRCLTKEMPPDSFFQTMYQYIAELPPEVKTPQLQYEERLAQCKACDSLLNGMCRVCGCFVEMRAAAQKNHCPALHPKW